jgi:aminoglycoside phosphotransferase (APT) family kinase protein
VADGADVDSGIVRLVAESWVTFDPSRIVLKLYPQVDGNVCAVDAGLLAVVDGTLPVTAPAAHETGGRDGWTYLLMSRLPGGALDAIWAKVPAADRAVLTVRVGELLAALHRVPPRVIAGWHPDTRWRAGRLAPYRGHGPGPVRRARSMAADRHDRLRADHAGSARVRAGHSRRLLRRR